MQTQYLRYPGREGHKNHLQNYYSTRCSVRQGEMSVCIGLRLGKYTEDNNML